MAKHNKNIKKLKPKAEIRNTRFGGSMTRAELKAIDKLATKLKISRTELIVRAVKYYDVNKGYNK